MVREAKTLFLSFDAMRICACMFGWSKIDGIVEIVGWIVEKIVCVVLLCDAFFCLNWCWVEGLRIWSFEQIDMQYDIGTCF